jgi:hypothetical protein
VEISTGFDPAKNTQNVICWMVRESESLGCVDVYPGKQGGVYVSCRVGDCGTFNIQGTGVDGK